MLRCAAVPHRARPSIAFVLRSQSSLLSPRHSIGIMTTAAAVAPEAAEITLARGLGFERDGKTTRHASHYTPPAMTIEKLICIPHGRTPSNANILSQSHAEGPDAALLPESLEVESWLALDLQRQLLVEPLNTFFCYFPFRTLPRAKRTSCRV